MSAYIMGVLKMQLIKMINCALHYIGNIVLQFNVYLTLSSVNDFIYFRDCDRKLSESVFRHNNALYDSCFRF